MLEMPIPQNPTSCIEELQRQAFDILPGTVNAIQGAGLVHTSGISQAFLVAGRRGHMDITQSARQCAFCFGPSGGIYIYPQKII